MLLLRFADRDHLRSRGLAVQRNLFDPSTGLMRPKSRSGHFDSSFVANRWGGAYTEGSAWHHSFPPFAVDELAKVHGGKVGATWKKRVLRSVSAAPHDGGCAGLVCSRSLLVFATHVLWPAPRVSHLNVADGILPVQGSQMFLRIGSFDASLS
jgi:hypothetical protein